MGKKLTTEEFRNRATIIHGDKYNYSLVVYVKSSECVEIICPEHGSFWQQPNNHLYGKGCSACAHKIAGALASTRNKYQYNNILETENEITSYLLGAFITDGCIHLSETRPNARSLTLDSQDYDWLENIKSVICPDLKIRQDKTCFRLAFDQHKFIDWFIARGISPNKSLTARLPIVPRQFWPDLIRGCIDGDGCVGNYIQHYYNKRGDRLPYYKPQCYICSANEPFIEDITNILTSVGLRFFTDKVKQTPSIIDGRVIHANDTSYLYKVRFSSRIADEFLQWAYYAGHKLSLPRKASIANDIHNMYVSKDHV